jgi:hypothetical protein
VNYRHFGSGGDTKDGGMVGVEVEFDVVGSSRSLSGVAVVVSWSSEISFGCGRRR